METGVYHIKIRLSNPWGRKEKQILYLFKS